MSRVRQAVDSLDQRLIGLLLLDPRRSFASLARALSVTDAIVYRRTRKLLQTGVIQFTASANFVRVAGALPVVLGIKVAPENVQSIMNILAGHPRMVAVNRTSGRFGIMAVVYLVDLNDMASFMTGFLPQIAGVEAVETVIVALTKTGRVIFNANGPVDAKDRAIMSQLRQNSRQDAVQISRKTGLSARTVRRRLTRLTECGFVSPKVVVKSGTAGFCEGAISLKVKPEYLIDVWDYVCTHVPRTHYASLTAGPFNILMRVWGESREALKHLAEEELGQLRGVIDSKLLVIEEITLGRWHDKRPVPFA